MTRMAIPQLANRRYDSLHDAFEAQARRTPDRMAVCAGEDRLSYDELNRRSSRLALELIRAGAGVESCVGLCVERGVEMIVGMLAILKSGGVYIPIDPDYPAARIRYIVEDGPMVAIVCSMRTAPLVASFGIPLVSTVVDRKEAEAPTAGWFRVSRQNLAYVIYTSGSTGQPKGVLVEHGNVLHLLEQMLHVLECDERDVWAQFHSISFDFSVWEIWGALLTGARLVIVPAPLARAPAAFSAFVDEQQISVLNITPTAFRRFSQAYLTPSGTTTLRLVIFGGEPLSIRTLEPWIHAFGDARPMLINMYGITETTVHVTHLRITASHLHETRSLIGIPICGVQVHLLDANGLPVPAGCPGRVYISGAGVARGYRGRPVLTAERFVPHPDAAMRGTRLYDSGDVAVRLETGELAFLGRADDQIKISGYRIEPGEIEACLFGHPDVAAVLVMAEELGPDAVGLIAYVMLRAEAPHAEERERVAGALARMAQSKLPVYMRPSDYRFVSSFPLTAHGKIDRESLRATTAQHAGL
jgi:amino acid adenylation domain-containing protein